jgi:hypothetical protein
MPPSRHRRDRIRAEIHRRVLGGSLAVWFATVAGSDGNKEPRHSSGRPV